MSAVHALIPVRSGSVRVPGKNLRTVGDLPLFLHTVRNARAAGVFDSIQVSTDDPTIQALCRVHGVSCLKRPPAFAGPDTTVLDVATMHHLGVPGDTTAILQATSPFLTSGTIAEAVTDFQEDAGAHWDILLTVEGVKHLHWWEGTVLQNRVNSEHIAPKLERETGGLFVIRNIHLSGDVFMQRVLRWVVQGAEAIDIDTHVDFEVARMHARRKRIVFVITAGTKTGSGHLRRALQLADELSHHDIEFRFAHEQADWAQDAILAAGYPITSMRPGEAPDMLVFDHLDTDLANVAQARANGSSVVTLEDCGTGASHADAVINELYQDVGEDHRHYGPRYAVMRPEFIGLPPKVLHRQATRPRRLLLTFGGSDPTHLTSRILGLVPLGCEVRVIVPPYMGTTPLPSNETVVFVTEPCMAEQFMWADLAVTSCGRTVHEAAACGTPTIAIAANLRENRHTTCLGVLYLGHHAHVGDDEIRTTIQQVIDDDDVLLDMGVTMRKQVDGRGARRIVRIIDGILEDR